MVLDSPPAGLRGHGHGPAPSDHPAYRQPTPHGIEISVHVCMATGKLKYILAPAGYEIDKDKDEANHLLDSLTYMIKLDFKT